MHIDKRCYRNREERVNDTAWEVTESYIEKVRFEFNREDMKMADIWLVWQGG